MALEGAQLVGLIAAGIELNQLGEEGLGLEGSVALKLGDDPGPVVGEGVGAGAVGAWAGAGVLRGRRWPRTDWWPSAVRISSVAPTTRANTPMS